MSVEQCIINSLAWGTYNCPKARDALALKHRLTWPISLNGAPVTLGVESLDLHLKMVLLIIILNTECGKSRVNYSSLYEQTICPTLIGTIISHISGMVLAY